jgi:prepilin signal peptidase PulO-like enzyme (type II secretory pathway)
LLSWTADVSLYRTGPPVQDYRIAQISLLSIYLVAAFIDMAFPLAMACPMSPHFWFGAIISLLSISLPVVAAFIDLAFPKITIACLPIFVWTILIGTLEHEQ